MAVLHVHIAIVAWACLILCLLLACIDFGTDEIEHTAGYGDVELEDESCLLQVVHPAKDASSRLKVAQKSEDPPHISVTQPVHQSEDTSSLLEVVRKSQDPPYIDTLALVAPSPADVAIMPCRGFECLKKYVQLPDPEYQWENLGMTEKGTDTTNGLHFKSDVLYMTSGLWRSAADINKPLWHHHMFVVTPSNLGNFSTAATQDIGMIYAGNPIPLEDVEDISNHPDSLAAIQTATRTGMIVTALFGVPNKNFSFKMDPWNRSFFYWGGAEWIKTTSWYMNVLHQDQPEWPIEMPMLRAVVRAMDTLADFTSGAEEAGLMSHKIERFAIAGCSKRSISTWGAAALDSRVILALPASLHVGHQPHWDEPGWEQLGGPPYSGYPYVVTPDTINQDLAEKGLAQPTDEEVENMYNITNPSYWLEKTEHAAKFVLQTGNDNFVVPDNLKYWWDDVPGEKLYNLLPNEKHLGWFSLNDYIPSAAMWLKGKLLKEDVPSIHCIDEVVGDTAYLWCNSTHTPIVVQKWEAHTCNDKKRDFRLQNTDVGDECKECGIQIFPFPVEQQPEFQAKKATCKNNKVYYTNEVIAESSLSSLNARVWSVNVSAPGGSKWASFFLQFQYEWPRSGDVFTQTSRGFVVPEINPVSEKDLK